MVGGAKRNVPKTLASHRLDNIITSAIVVHAERSHVTIRSLQVHENEAQTDSRYINLDQFIMSPQQNYAKISPRLIDALTYK